MLSLQDLSNEYKGQLTAEELAPLLVEKISEINSYYIDREDR